MPVQIPPTAPDLFVHQTIDEVQMNGLHRLQELEADMIEASSIICGKRVDVFQTDAPNPAKLGIFAELFGDIPQCAGRCVLCGELAHARTAMHLNGEIPE